MPDRISVEPESPFYDERFANVAVFFDGRKRPNDVREFCMSEGWIKKQLRMKNGKLKRERGKVTTIKMRGKVQAVWIK